jgi:release factor glutamine methyltransferase
MITVLECIDSGTRYLEKRAIHDARRNMELLICHHLSCTRTQLYMQFDRPITEEILIPLREDLKKRGEGIPLQHIIGNVDFYHRKFKCDTRALIPRPETEELLEFLLTKINNQEPLDILDMGCGSGILGLSLAAEYPNSFVTLADFSPEALLLSRENASSLQLHNLKLVETNLFSHIEKKFDLIVANLPYVPENDSNSLEKEVLQDPHMALFGGADGLDIIRVFLADINKYLKVGGLVALEIGIHQARLVEKLMVDAGLTNIEIKSDLSGIERFPFGYYSG